MEGILKIMFVEDSLRDVELIWREIEKEKIAFNKLLVDNKEKFLTGLRSFTPDIIISDYSLPVFDGMKALLLRNELVPQTPFILITGSLNEEVAVECMKAGADDYILKENLSRLGPAIINSVNKISMQKLKEDAETALRESEKRYYNLYNNAVIGLYRTNSSGQILMANRKLIKMLGFQNFEELAQRNLNASGYGLSYNRKQFLDKIETEDEVREVEAIWIGKDGREIYVKESATAVRDCEGNILYFDGIVEDITERKLAVDALHGSQHLIEGILNAIPARVFWKDLNLIYLGCNKAFANDAGYTHVKDIIGKNDYQMVWHQQAELYRNDDLEVIRRGNSKFLIEESQSTPEGKIITLLTNKVPLCNSDGEITGIIGTYIDITDRKRAEEAVLKYETRFRSYFDSSIVGIAITSPTKGWIEANAHLCKMLGYTLEELLQTTWSELTHPEDLKADLDKFNSMLTGEIDGYHLDKRFKCKNGEFIWTSLSVRCVRLTNGKVDHVVALMLDISERKRAEDAIISERSLLRTLIDNLPALIYVKDSSGRKVIANKQDVKYIGFNEEAEVIGKTDMELFPGKPGKLGYADDKEIIRTGKAFFKREEIFIDKNGTKRWLLSSKMPLFDKVGKCTGLVGIAHDITEIKNSEAELILAKKKAEESDKLKTAFLANMSHEIRTPLNAIIGFSSILGQTSLTDEKRESFIQIIDKSSDQLINIISDIVDISTIEANQISLSQDQFSLDKMMDELYLTFEDQAAEKGLKLIYKKPEENKIIQLISDERRLKQALSNLLNNALKFTHMGEIELGYNLNKSHLEIFVRDTGIGVSIEKQSLIFERFFQADPSATRKYGGNGLGLSIAKALVEKLGGKITLKSEEGKGSVFSVHLPAEIIKSKPVTPFIKNAKQDSLVNVEGTILIAEDEANNFLLLNEILSENQIAVLHAWNGQEAVDLVKANNAINLVLMDIKMPIMNGFEAMHLIKAQNPGLPVIAVSAYAMAEDRENAIREGFDNFISKPIKPENLLKILKKYLC
jgi:PAS domain S-box-containing protein